VSETKVRIDRFTRILLVIIAVAFGVRVAYVAIAKSGPCVIRLHGQIVGNEPSKCATGDEVYYNAESNYIANGHGFNDQHYTTLHPGATSAPPTAAHPPLTVLVLTPVAWLTDHPPLSWVIHERVHDHLREDRYAMALLGTLLVGMIGLLGKRVGGSAVGLVAAGIAALLPTLWVNDAAIMSETITGVAVVGALLCALRVWERPTLLRAAALGVFCGLAALARAELILFVPLLALAVPLVVKRAWTERTSLATAAVVASLLVIAPWVGFNLSRFHDPTFISTNDGVALLGSNCKEVYHGGGTGLTSLTDCLQPVPPGDESQVEKVYRRRALDFMKAHAGRVPMVVLARIGRTWGVFRPADMITYNINEDREEWVTRLGFVGYYPVLVFALAGAVVLWRRKRRGVLWVLGVPAIAVTIGVAVTYGQTRFRAAAEPSLAILAAVAAVAVVEAIRRSRTDDAPPVAAEPA
jgi:4-amino-4-deoxy-L-arabinose transferase-like glycosyltransferase